MSIGKFRPSALASLAALLVCSSCMSVSYDGDSREPKAKRSEVAVFMDKSRIPVAGYKVMGTATVSAPAGRTAAEAEMKLIDFARSRGADGVLILSVDKVDSGTVRPDQALSVTPSSGAQPEEFYKVTMKAQLLEFPKKEVDPLAKFLLPVETPVETKAPAADK